MPASAPYHGDSFPGMNQDLIAYVGGHQGHADGLLARAGVDDGHLVGQQPPHRDLHGRIRAGEAAIPDTPVPARLRGALEAPPSLVARSSLLSPGAAAPLRLAHVTTPGASRPGCSKNTCASSHSTW